MAVRNKKPEVVQVPINTTGMSPQHDPLLSDSARDMRVTIGAPTDRMDLSDYYERLRRNGGKHGLLFPFIQHMERELAARSIPVMHFELERERWDALYQQYGECDYTSLHPLPVLSDEDLKAGQAVQEQAAAQAEATAVVTEEAEGVEDAAAEDTADTREG